MKKERTMHDIDRITTEYEPEMDIYETDHFEYPDGSELYPEVDMESPFGEAEEMALAAELMSLSDEAELDQFLGRLFKRVWRGVRKVGSFVGRIARPLGGILRGVAKKALPFVGGAVGSLIPGAGTAIGTALGGALSSALEMELEGMEPEDQEFEMARRFVRVAGTAARQAALSQPGVDPQAAARSAVMAALRQHVPAAAGVNLGPVTAAVQSTNSGRWIRRGRKIILLGV
jgi:uncharacterized protein (DUF697 family)